jgi:hypothetical protein
MSDIVDSFCMPKGFVFQPSFFKQINRKAKASDRERAYRYICEYMFLGKRPEITEGDILADFWDGTYPTLHKVKASVLAKMKNDTSGSTSGSTSQNTNQGQGEVQGGHVGKYLFQRNKEKGIRRKDKGVCPPISPKGEIASPTLDDVKKFAEESGLKNINPVRFYKYYKAMGWKRNGEPIEDWRSLMEYWTEPETPPKPERTYHPIEKLTECPMCYSTDVDQHGMDGRCNQCKAELVWSTWQGEWRPVVV